MDEDAYVVIFMVTRASVHDASINISKHEKTNYGDRGYLNSHCNGNEGTMDNAVSG